MASSEPDNRFEPEPERPGRQERGASSKAGSGCLVLFGLPFTAAGLFIGSLAVRQLLDPGSVPLHSKGGDWGPVPATIFLSVFALVFTGVGLAVMLGGLFGARALKQAAQRKAERPGEPWTWKKEWADGAISPASRGQAFGLLGFTILWNLISFPIAFVAVPTEWSKGNPAILLVLLFPAVGVLLGISAVGALLRLARFRAVKLRMDLPGVLGGRLRGEIDTGTALPGDVGVELSLTCSHKEWRGSGKNRRVEETILWQEAQVIPPERITPGLTGSIVPVDFRLPFRLPPAAVDRDDAWDEWRLDARASISGPDFDVSFDLPVFRTRDSVDDGLEVEAGNVPIVSSELRRPGPESGVRIGTDAATGDTELVFEPGRGNGGAGVVPCTAIAIGLLGAGLAVFHFDGPLFPAGGLLLVGTIALALVLEMAIGQRRVAFSRDGITIRGLFLRLGTRSLPRAGIEAIAVRIAKQPHGVKGRAGYEVVARTTRPGPKDPIEVIAGDFRDKGEAEWVAEEIRKALGLGR